MTPREPQSAADYDDRTTAAVKSVLIEIGQVLGSFKGKFAVVGGAVPWLLLDNDDMHHVGTIDIDLSLDAEALADTAYVALIDALRGNGYEQRETLRRFQLVRHVGARDGGPPIDVIVDFLMPRHAEIEKRIPPLLDNFAVQRADGADLATRFYQMTAISGPMPNGGTNTVEVAVCSIPALLAMKGHALNGRLKQKDAYDVYFCIRNFPGGIAELAAACRPLLDSQRRDRVPLHRGEIRRAGRLRPDFRETLRSGYAHTRRPLAGTMAARCIRTGGCVAQSARFANVAVAALERPPSRATPPLLVPIASLPHKMRVF